jgi:hypothetical protein
LKLNREIQTSKVKVHWQEINNEYAGKKMTLVSCIAGVAIGVALVGFMPTLLSEQTALAAAEQPPVGSFAIVKCSPVTRVIGNVFDTWDCNMVVGQDGYIWFVAVNDTLEETDGVDNVIKVLWEYQLEKGISTP